MPFPISHLPLPPHRDRCQDRELKGTLWDPSLRQGVYRPPRPPPRAQAAASPAEPGGAAGDTHQRGAPPEAPCRVVSGTNMLASPRPATLPVGRRPRQGMGVRGGDEGGGPVSVLQPRKAVILQAPPTWGISPVRADRVQLARCLAGSWHRAGAPETWAGGQPPCSNGSPRFLFLMCL